MKNLRDEIAIDILKLVLKEEYLPALESRDNDRRNQIALRCYNMANAMVQQKDFFDKVEKNYFRAADIHGSIREMELSLRTQKHLYALVKDRNLSTLGDLVEIKESDVLKIPNFGRKSLDELNYELEKHFRLKLKKREEL